jgi:hypothetical protein
MAIMDQNYFRAEIVWDGVKNTVTSCFSCSTNIRISVLSSKARSVLIYRQDIELTNTL